MCRMTPGVARPQQARGEGKRAHWQGRAYSRRAGGGPETSGSWGRGGFGNSFVLVEQSDKAVTGFHACVDNLFGVQVQPIPGGVQNSLPGPRRGHRKRRTVAEHSADIEGRPSRLGDRRQPRGCRNVGSCRGEPSRHVSHQPRPMRCNALHTWRTVANYAQNTKLAATVATLQRGRCPEELQTKVSLVDAALGGGCVRPPEPEGERMRLHHGAKKAVLRPSCKREEMRNCGGYGSGGHLLCLPCP